MNIVRKNQVLALLLLLSPVYAVEAKKQNRVGRLEEKRIPVFTKDSKTGPGMLIAKPGPDVNRNAIGGEDSPVDEYALFSRGVTSVDDTTSQTSCGDGDGFEVTMEITPDCYACETYWTLKNLDTDDVIAQVDYIECDNYEYFEYNFCLDASYCYKFEIIDTYGDGMNINGAYDFIVDGIVISTSADDPNANFGYGESVTFGDCIGPLPPSPPCASGDDKFVLELRTDLYGAETTWQVEMKKNGDFESYFGNESGYPDQNRQREKYCIPDDECYKFVIYDSYGDGMCCGLTGRGGYRVIFNNEIIIESLFRGGEFEFVEFNCD